MNKYKIKLNYDQLNSLIFSVNLAKKYCVDNITQLDMEQGMPQIVIDNRKKTLENLKDIYKKILELILTCTYRRYGRIRMKKYDIKLNDYQLSLIINSIGISIDQLEARIKDIKRYVFDQQGGVFGEGDQYFIEKLSHKIIELKDIRDYLLG